MFLAHFFALMLCKGRREHRFRLQMCGTVDPHGCAVEG